MYLALVYYPAIDWDDLHKLRKRYDPYAHLMREHMPFVFPVDEKIGRNKFKMHISAVLRGWKPFDAHFCKLQKTPDHWLMLTPEEGNADVVRLHDALYSGILAPFLRKDLPFVPHISLGHFGNEQWELEKPLKKIGLDVPKYEKALSEFESVNLDLWRTIDQLTIVFLDQALTKCTDLETIEFGR